MEISIPLSSSLHPRPKVNWAEIDNDFPEPASLPKVGYTEDPNSKVIESSIIDTVNSSGKPIKYLRKVVEKRVVENVHPLVEKRRGWKRFGGEDNASSILDNGEANSGEEVFLKLHLKSYNEEDTKETESRDSKRAPISVSKAVYTKIYKGSSALSMGLASSHTLSQPTPDTIASVGKLVTSKYVPPHARRDTGGPSTDLYSVRERREDTNTLRITNLSTDTTESDLKELTQKFGHTTRVFIARDREANVCKGFAFVSYQYREDAENALKILDGHGYDNLILRVEWANPKD